VECNTSRAEMLACHTVSYLTTKERSRLMTSTSIPADKITPSHDRR
jgi:hypothetical protein